jgi:hypothetical protein
VTAKADDRWPKNQLSPVSRRDLIKRLRMLGAVGHFREESNNTWSGGQIQSLSQSNHGEEIRPDLLTKILRDGGISREEWSSTT